MNNERGVETFGNLEMTTLTVNFENCLKRDRKLEETLDKYLFSFLLGAGIMSLYRFGTKRQGLFL